jgi:hypothetical protein
MVMHHHPLMQMKLKTIPEQAIWIWTSLVDDLVPAGAGVPLE